VVGLRINNYELVGVLGQGGMGTVYLARHPFMGRQAAIKILRPELMADATLVARFQNEARAVNAIHHPNIIDIIDVGTVPGSQRPYLMMEYLNGETLGRRLERSPILPVAEAVEITCQTASALGAVHAQGIIHRDLKPDNLFLVDGPSTRVKVLDFGVAKLRRELSGDAVNTHQGALLGTPRYMSPEQCLGGMEIDHRTDVYALGVILYQLLCGSAPFMSEGFGDVMMRHMNEAPVPPRQRRAGIPAAVEAAVLRALAKRPADRFADMAAFEAALRDAPDEPLEASATPVDRAVVPAAGVSLGTTSTLSGAAGALLPGTVPQRRRRALLGGAVIAALGLAIVLLARPPGSSTAPAASSATAPAPLPASAAVTTAPALPKPARHRPRRRNERPGPDPEPSPVDDAPVPTRLPSAFEPLPDAAASAPPAAGPTQKW
jgi:serine/threonine protein kinase